MKKVLFVIDTLGSGGGQKSLINFLNELDPKAYGLQVDLLLFAKRGLFLGQLPDYVNVLPTPKEVACMFEPLGSPDFRKNLCPKGLYGKLRRLATKSSDHSKHPELHDIQLFWNLWRPLIPDLPGEYDVAVGGLEGTCDYYVMDKVRARRKVLWFHNNYADHGYNAGFDKPYFEQADKVVTISDVCLQSLENAFPDLKGKFCVLGNITSRSTIQRLSLEYVEDAHTAGVTNILTIGRFYPQKGYDLLLDAAERLDLDFRWRIIGDGPQRQAIERRVKASHLDGKVVLMGLRSNPYPYIKACDVFVQTSRYEGKSVVIDEAKALCRPIVVTDYATARDAVEDGVNGVVCGMSGEAIADAVGLLMSNRGLRDSLVHELEADRGCLGSSIDDYISTYLGVCDELF